MANPDKYEVGYDFSDYQASNPDDPLPGSSLDVELAGIALSIDEIVDALAEVRRSDGALVNASVTPESLSTEARALMAAAGTPRGAWATATAYALSDVITKDDVTYLCAVAHTSGTFSTDLAAVKWLVIYAGGAEPGDGSVTSAKLMDGSVTTAKLAAEAVTLAKIASAAIASIAAVATAVSAQRASNLADLADAATARTNLGLGTAAVAAVGDVAGALPVLNSATEFDLARIERRVRTAASLANFSLAR